jgi:hypothetical protein
MSDAWYLYDGYEQEGPLTWATLIERLQSLQDTKSVSVWRPGYKDWLPAEQLLEFARVEQPFPNTVSTPSYKGKYALYGLLVGAAVCALDYFLQWRGNQFSPWEGDGIGENIGYIVGLCGSSALLGFMIGLFRGAGKSSGPRITHDDPRTFDHRPSKSIRYTNFIARNWRGEYSLVATYWGFGFVGNVAAGLLPVLVAAALPKSDYDPRLIFMTMVAAWISVGAVGTWQCVAVWRSASRHIKKRSAVGKRSIWAGLAKLVVVLGFIRLTGEFVNSGFPQLTEASRMAFLGDPDIPAYSIRVMRNGTEAEIVGGFKYGLTDDFAKILTASRQIKVIHLDSLGGRIGEAIRLNKLIRENGISTYVSAECYSACTVAFAGGRTRILREGAKLGFHAPSFPGISKQELLNIAQDQVNAFSAAGFDRNFVDKALTTPSDQLWKPSDDVLLAAHVITGTSDGSDFAVSGLGAETSRDQIASKLTSAAPILQTLRLKFPADYDQVIAAYYDSFVAGKTEIQAVIAAKDRLNEALLSIRPMADDQVLVDLAIALADEYVSLNAKSPTLCYQYISGNSGNVDFSESIPETLLDREKEINRRAIETASLRQELKEAAVSELTKRLGIRLEAKGVSREQFDLISSSKVPSSRYSEYCNTWIALFREVSQFRVAEGGSIMRQLFAHRGN